MLYYQKVIWINYFHNIIVLSFITRINFLKTVLFHHYLIGSSSLEIDSKVISILIYLPISICLSHTSLQLNPLLSMSPFIWSLYYIFFFSSSSRSNIFLGIFFFFFLFILFIWPNHFNLFLLRFSWILAMFNFFLIVSLLIPTFFSFAWIPFVFVEIKFIAPKIKGTYRTPSSKKQLLRILSFEKLSF